MKFYETVSIEMLNKLPKIRDVRFDAVGRNFICCHSEDVRGILNLVKIKGDPKQISGESNVRGGVGYGGGEFGVYKDFIVFSDKSGSLYKKLLSGNSEPIRLTPAWGACGSPEVSPDGQWILYVFQDGDTNGLAVTCPVENSWPARLVMGADFYMQPCWHPSGEWIAWAEWNHPWMPWDASCVKIGEVGGTRLTLFQEDWIAGERDRSASQPGFSPDGKWLSYIIREGEWDNLVVYHLKKHTGKIAVKGEGYHLRLPEWIQGMRSYAWHHDSRHIIYTKYYRGQSSLWKVNIADGKSESINTGNIHWITQMDTSPTNDDLVFLGSSSAIPRQIVQIHKGKINIRQSALEKGLAARIPKPEEIEFTTSKCHKSFGFLYLPGEKKKDPTPLVIHVHGGPTMASTLSFSSDVAWFTSRGYAYAQLNYRGSSGYGYSYQEELKHQWGIVDVEDAYFFAKHLIGFGAADPGRIVLMGSSAGGFTVLRALISYPGFFRAGICSYGVSDLLFDAQNTHKFERFYHRFLTGDLARNKQRFIDRSPINHIEKIRDPLALFHGEDDRVVSVLQTLRIFEILKSQDTPCILKVYANEGHGFRNTENIVDFYKTIEEFLDHYIK